MHCTAARKAPVYRGHRPGSIQGKGSGVQLPMLHKRPVARSSGLSPPQFHARQRHQMRRSGDMRVTERNNGCKTHRPSQNQAYRPDGALRASQGEPALILNGGLTLKAVGLSFVPSATGNLRRSASQKGASGLRPRQDTRRPKPRRNCVVFPFPPLIGAALWVRADGAAQAGRPLVGDSLNSVRPARQIETLACRVLQPYEETCHV